MSQQSTDSISKNSKRIAKNTMLLYLRMIVVTIVSLYTARLVLRLLGIEDYGIYNVIGGVIGFMTVVTATMTSATQRFLAYDLGKNDLIQYERTYSMLLYIFGVFCAVSVLLMELIGPYCIQKYLVIPPDRLYAAQWLFQFTIINFVMTTMTIPQTASIISHEKMGIYAYFTFLDVAFKLTAVFALYITPIDKLITYGITSMLFQVLTTGITLFYCLKKIEGCKIIRHWDASLFKRLSSYAGWNLFGALSGVLTTHGLSILLNIFFGPTINAAKAIADKINAIIISFSSNFYMAVTPQIIKSYAAGDIDYTKKLVISSSKYSFFLLSILSFPLIFNMQSALELWLGADMISIEMIRFSQLELIKSLVFVLENPITMTIRATGNIKKYQIIVGIQTLMFLPICYIAFLSGFPAYSSMIILSLLLFVVQFFRVYLVRNVIHITLIDYVKKDIVPILITVVIITLVGNFVSNYYEEKNIISFIVNVMIMVGVNLAVVLLVGLRRHERVYILKVIQDKVLKK